MARHYRSCLDAGGIDFLHGLAIEHLSVSKSGMICNRADSLKRICKIDATAFACVMAVLVFALLLTFLGAVLTPFLIGAILAYLGHPAVTWGERRHVPRTVGTLLVVISILLLLVGLIFVLIPLIQSEVSQSRCS